MISHHGQRKRRGHTLHFGMCFTIWFIITSYWNTCVWLQVLMYLFFRPVAAFNIFSKWKLSKSQMLRILLSAHCFAKSEPSPKTLFYFSADHCSLVLQDIHIRQFYTLSHLFKYIIVSKPTDKRFVKHKQVSLTRTWVGGCSDMTSSFLGATWTPHPLVIMSSFVICTAPLVGCQSVTHFNFTLWLVWTWRLPTGDDWHIWHD